MSTVSETSGLSVVCVASHGVLDYLVKGVFVAPHVGCSKLVHNPSNLLYFPGWHSTFDKYGGQTSLIKVLLVSIKGSPFSISS